MPIGPPDPVFFASPEELRRWFVRHHRRGGQLWVGYHKRETGKPSLTWAQSVDEALCFGWIDGIRKSLGAEAYTIRFTPRSPTSRWSTVNVGRMEALEAEGRVTDAGRTAFAARRADKTGTYSYEERYRARLAPAEARQLRADADAWAFFSAQAPWYRRVAVFWLVSAKRPETRARRLATLIADSAAGRRLRGTEAQRPAPAPGTGSKPSSRVKLTSRMSSTKARR